MNIVIDGTNVPIELLESQKYKNMEVIPVRINSSSNKDYLTLRRGISAGFVEVTECEISTVGTVLARNNANIPLVLIDGDEILGAKQNRIMNRSLIVPPQTTLHVSVSCTEQGRWHYGRTRDEFINRNLESEYGENEEQFENFEFSDEAADFSTRRAKSQDLFENRSCQSTVWNSIANLERKTAFSSRTSALHDNFVNHRPKLNEYLRNFRLEYGQSGAIFIINGQIKGFELFANPSIYQDYHEKIFRSYIMEAITDYQSKYTYVIDDVREFLRELSHSEFRRSDSKGIGRHLHFANNFGYGAALLDGNNLVHINYFNNGKSTIKSNRRGQTRRYGSFRDFADDY